MLALRRIREATLLRDSDKVPELMNLYRRSDISLGPPVCLRLADRMGAVAKGVRTGGSFWSRNKTRPLRNNHAGQRTSDDLTLIADLCPLILLSLSAYALAGRIDAFVGKGNACVLKRKFHVTLLEHDEGVSVSCPELPGCHSQGKNVDEALENIEDGFRGYIDLYGEPETRCEIREMEVVTA